MQYTDDQKNLLIKLTKGYIVKTDPDEIRRLFPEVFEPQPIEIYSAAIVDIKGNTLIWVENQNTIRLSENVRWKWTTEKTAQAFSKE